jgi:hypothetical protein
LWGGGARRGPLADRLVEDGLRERDQVADADPAVLTIDRATVDLQQTRVVRVNLDR